MLSQSAPSPLPTMEVVLWVVYPTTGCQTGSAGFARSSSLASFLSSVFPCRRVHKHSRSSVLDALSVVLPADWSFRSVRHMQARSHRPSYVAESGDCMRSMSTSLICSRNGCKWSIDLMQVMSNIPLGDLASTSSKAMPPGVHSLASSSYPALQCSSHHSGCHSAQDGCA
jgi:hypothetical protein